tara:strand:- start:1644 stop:1760 length:117 start_codon:yes stop_codon:yes gene_type:complete
MDYKKKLEELNNLQKHDFREGRQLMIERLEFEKSFYKL